MSASVSVFLNVRDIERALKFYETLGFRITNQSEADGRTSYADLAMGGAEISLGAINSNDDPGFQSWVSTPLGAGVVIYVSVPNVDAVFERAQDAGAVIESAPHDRPYGRVAMINDPDGYTLSLITEPKVSTRRAPTSTRARSRGTSGAKTGRRARGNARKGVKGKTAKAKPRAKRAR
ncbi:MAG: VOC family protein [Thermoplasmatota archaeon]